MDSWVNSMIAPRERKDLRAVRNESSVKTREIEVGSIIVCTDDRATTVAFMSLRG